jgi:hypothetical protein
MSELRETTFGIGWEIVRTSSMGGLTLPDGTTPVSFLGEAHLTTEGRRLIFHGQASGGLNAAFYLERASTDVAFTGPARQIPTATSVRQPYFTPDCATLFYNTPANAEAIRVDYSD